MAKIMHTHTMACKCYFLAYWEGEMGSSFHSLLCWKSRRWLEELNPGAYQLRSYVALLGYSNTSPTITTSILDTPLGESLCGGNYSIATIKVMAKRSFFFLDALLPLGPKQTNSWKMIIIMSTMCSVLVDLLGVEMVMIGQSRGWGWGEELGTCI